MNLPNKQDYSITHLERLSSDKHSDLLGHLLSNKENEVLWICTQVPYSQPLILFATYEWAQ